MATTLTEQDGDKVLEVAASGKLTHRDYEQFVPTFERLVKQHGKIRVLFHMTDFHGWEAAALWEALTPLYVKTVVQAAKSAAWRARSSAITR